MVKKIKLLAKHTPQSLMVMTWSKDGKQWVNDFVEQSRTLDHYEKFDIVEAARFPCWFHSERYSDMVNHHPQIAELVKHGYDFLEVTVGNYKSILFKSSQFLPDLTSKKTNKKQKEHHQKK